MNTVRTPFPFTAPRWLRPVSAATSFGLLALGSAFAQVTSSSAPSRQELAQFDKNHNGVFDPDELAAMQAAEKKAGNRAAARFTSELVDD